MKPVARIFAVLFTSLIPAMAVPEAFKGLFEKGIAVKGQIGMVLPPKEIDKYVAKVEAEALEDPKWFREYSKQTKPGIPLPYDDKLGLTKQEYDEYLALWNKREFKPVEDVMLILRETGGTWSLTATSGAGAISTLRHHPDDDIFRSPNGELTRLDDIDAEPESILGAWTGREWKFEEETGLGTTKENFALGRYKDGKFGLVVYRVQELSSEGTRLLDRSIVVRFALGKAGQVTGDAPLPTPRR